MGGYQAGSLDDKPLDSGPALGSAVARRRSPGGTPSPTTVSVFEAPVRVWHWINAASLAVLAATGYWIGSPPASVGGEASSSFVFGYVRFAHFAAGYVFAIAFVARLYWALVGNRYARQIFVLPLWRGSFWRGILHEMKWYGFAAKAPKAYAGHNPLARAAMVFMVTLPSVFMITTGFALYSEGEAPGSWQKAAFGWVFEVWPNSQDVHTWHHLVMWVLVTFVIIHLYVSVRESLISGHSTFSVMWSGRRTFHRGPPEDGGAS